MYYIYHIPGKKIGVTCNLNNRVTVQQGYKPDEYEVLETHEDIDLVSIRERELQKKYGYKVDLIININMVKKDVCKIEFCIGIVATYLLNVL